MVLYGFLTETGGLFVHFLELLLELGENDCSQEQRFKYLGVLLIRAKWSLRWTDGLVPQHQLCGRCVAGLSLRDTVKSSDMSRCSVASKGASWDGWGIAFWALSFVVFPDSNWWKTPGQTQNMLEEIYTYLFHPPWEGLGIALNGAKKVTGKRNICLTCCHFEPAPDKQLGMNGWMDKWDFDAFILTSYTLLGSHANNTLKKQSHIFSFY